MRLYVLSFAALLMGAGCQVAEAGSPPAKRARADFSINKRGPGPGPRGPGQGRGSGQGRELSRKACEGKKAGATCEFETPRGNVSGHCRETPRGELMCLSKRMEERQKRAKEACKGKKAGDSCKIKGPNGEIDGMCIQGKGAPMCRPNRRRGGR